eukprot:COSAG01_NODE_56642_length_317_cov_0.637615_2_plen_30_part_01
MLLFAHLAALMSVLLVSQPQTRTVFFSTTA